MAITEKDFYHGQKLHKYVPTSTEFCLESLCKNLGTSLETARLVYDYENKLNLVRKAVPIVAASELDNRCKILFMQSTRYSPLDMDLKQYTVLMSEREEKQLKKKMEAKQSQVIRQITNLQLVPELKLRRWEEAIDLAFYDVWGYHPPLIKPINISCVKPFEDTWPVHQVHLHFNPEFLGAESNDRYLSNLTLSFPEIEKGCGIQDTAGLNGATVQLLTDYNMRRHDLGTVARFDVVTRLERYVDRLFGRVPKSDDDDEIPF
jgi:hypothetical protein